MPEREIAVSLHVPARDRISLSRIGVFAHHGVYAEEEKLGQRFYISVTLGLDLTEAGRNDDLEASVSYADIAQLVQEIAVGQRFRIIEALAEAIATAILAGYPRVADIAVTVEKPGAAVAAILDGIAVTISRARV
ncbi:MAG: dihydroneopterin aldolase [Rhizobiales bacterium PAR1]|nr:MAG: dihydroneopterin aldolase [Rhizobiales bacterium PAR1]